MITSSRLKHNGISGGNKAPQGYASATSGSSRKNRFGIRRAFSRAGPEKEYLGGCMAKMIEFYIPQSFRKVSKWLPPDERGKVLEFPAAVLKSA
jgi:hypothetical protein